MTYEVHTIDRNAWIPGSNTPIVTDYATGYRTIKQAANHPHLYYGFRRVYSVRRDKYADHVSLQDYMDGFIPASQIIWHDSPNDEN